MSGTVKAWQLLGRYVPWLMLTVLLAATYFFWQQAHRSSIQRQRAEFDAMVSDAVNRTLRRISYDEQILNGIRAFYLNQSKMERQEFKGYIASLEIEKIFPGVRGISFAPLVSDSEKTAHVEQQRKSGLPQYQILPAGRRASYAPVAYIEPYNDRNARVLGFDNMSEQTRKNTLELARDEDRAVISDKLTLLQDGNRASLAGFLMFLPVYKHGAAHDTLAARRANIEGWFAVSFRMSDLLDDVFQGHLHDFGIIVADGTVVSDKNRMYSSPERVSLKSPPLFMTNTRLKISGHTWIMQLFSLPEFEARRNLSEERQVIVWGGVLSLLLPLIAWMFMQHQKRVTDMASRIRQELDMRRQAENMSNDLSSFNKIILEKSSAGIAVYRHSGSCVMVNDAYASAMGKTTDELLAQDFRSSASWQINGLLDLANQALASRLTVRHDVECEISPGKVVVLDCIFSGIDISGERHLLLITNDVSDRVKAERALTESKHQLERKEMAKTRFLAAAGHDLRQPLTAANMFIHALKLSALTPRQSVLIERLDHSMSTFGGLLDALLNVSKLDAGIIKTRYSSIKVPDLIIWVEQNFAPMAREKKLAFRLYFPLKQTLFVRSDIGLVKSVLMNLVANAIKFTDAGSILVSARARGGEVLFQVWDTGMGIPDEYIEQIFDEFYQIDNPQRDRGGGLGLGLSIVKRTLALLGAKIECRSSIGRGTVFEFRLPLDGASYAPAVQRAPVLQDKTAPDSMFAIGKKIILVEDDELVAQATAACLAEMGGLVKCFGSAEEALINARTDATDCYIVDYMLGGSLNGIQLLRLLREQLGKPIHAVLMTGDTSSNFIRESADLDWPVKFKPVDVSELLASLYAQESSELQASAPRSELA